MREECTCCLEKHKKRDDKEYRALMNRLKRIEGQVRGVGGMLEADAYCTDIILQVSAITSALNRLFNSAATSCTTHTRYFIMLHLIPLFSLFHKFL